MGASPNLSSIVVASISTTGCTLLVDRRIPFCLWNLKVIITAQQISTVFFRFLSLLFLLFSLFRFCIFFSSLSSPSPSLESIVITAKAIDDNDDDWLLWKFKAWWIHLWATTSPRLLDSSFWALVLVNSFQGPSVPCWPRLRELSSKRMKREPQRPLGNVEGRS